MSFALRFLVAMAIAAGASQVAGAQPNSRSIQGNPSWFPKVSCREAWGNRALDRYDSRIDSKSAPGVGNTGYDNYKARISRESGVDRVRCYKDWTVLVYMAADNDLSPYAFWDLYEMEGAFKGGHFAGSTLKTDLVVQADTAGRTGIRRLHVFQRTDADYVAPKGKSDFASFSPEDIRSPIVGLLDEKTPATSEDHKKRLRAFLDWGMRAYPAEHYFVIVWGHGQGWAAEPRADSTANIQSRFISPSDLPISFDDMSLEAPASTAHIEKAPFKGRFGGLAFSETKGDYLSIPSLAGILREVASGTLEGKREIDVYASDACLMQMTEVAYEISDSVRFISGSAQVHTYLGFPYRQLLYQINSGRFYGVDATVGKQDEAFLLAKMLPILTEKSLNPNSGQQGRADKEASRTFTMSSLSAADLHNRLVPSLDRLGTALLNYINEDTFRAMDLQYIAKTSPSFMGGSRELGSFLGLLRIQLLKEAQSKGAFSKAAQELVKAMDETRGAIQMTSIEYGFGSRYREAAESLHLLGFRSIGIWIPQTPQEFKTRIEDFQQSRFYSEVQPAQSSPWEKWLRAVYAPQSSK